RVVRVVDRRPARVQVAAGPRGGGNRQHQTERYDEERDAAPRREENPRYSPHPIAHWKLTFLTAVRRTTSRAELDVSLVRVCGRSRPDARKTKTRIAKKCNGLSSATAVTWRIWGRRADQGTSSTRRALSSSRTFWRAGRLARFSRCLGSLSRSKSSSLPSGHCVNRQRPLRTL